AGLPLGDHYTEYADALMELRLLPEAATAARRGMEEFSAAGVPLMAAEAQLRVAQLALLAGDYAGAAAASAAAAATFRRQTRGAPVLVRLRGRVAAALADGLRGRDREALAHCRRGLGDLARHRSGLPSVELRALASGHGTELGRIGLDIVVREGSPARVLNWM